MMNGWTDERMKHWGEKNDERMNWWNTELMNGWTDEALRWQKWWTDERMKQNDERMKQMMNGWTKMMNGWSKAEWTRCRFDLYVIFQLRIYYFWKLSFLELTNEQIISSLYAVQQSGCSLTPYQPGLCSTFLKSPLLQPGDHGKNTQKLLFNSILVIIEFLTERTAVYTAFVWSCAGLCILCETECEFEHSVWYFALTWTELTWLCNSFQVTADKPDHFLRGPVPDRAGKHSRHRMSLPVPVLEA